MSITAYTGLSEAGKSHGVVKHVNVPKLEKAVSYAVCEYPIPTGKRFNIYLLTKIISNE